MAWQHGRMHIQCTYSPSLASNPWNQWTIDEMLKFKPSFILLPIVGKFMFSLVIKSNILWKTQRNVQSSLCDVWTWIDKIVCETMAWNMAHVQNPTKLQFRDNLGIYETSDKILSISLLFWGVWLPCQSLHLCLSKSIHQGKVNFCSLHFCRTFKVNNKNKILFKFELEASLR